MRVSMKKTSLGSPDGIEVNSYEAEQSYTVPDELGEVFVREGWAEELSEEAEAEAPSDAESAEDDPTEEEAETVGNSEGNSESDETVENAPA